MIIFQATRWAAVKEEENAEIKRGKAVKELTISNPEFKRESQGLTPKQQQALAMTSKYRDDFHKLFLNVGGTEEQWKQMVLAYDGNRRQREGQKQVRDATERQTMAAVPKQIKVEADSEARRETKNRNEFLDQRPEI